MKILGNLDRFSVAAGSFRASARYRRELSRVGGINSAICRIKLSLCVGGNSGAGGGNRTLTGSEPHGILSPARLPVSPLRRVELSGGERNRSISLKLG